MRDHYSRPHAFQPIMSTYGRAPDSLWHDGKFTHSRAHSCRDERIDSYHSFSKHDKDAFQAYRASASSENFNIDLVIAKHAQLMKNIQAMQQLIARSIGEVNAQPAGS